MGGGLILCVFLWSHGASELSHDFTIRILKIYHAGLPLVFVLIHSTTTNPISCIKAKSFLRRSRSCRTSITLHVLVAHFSSLLSVFYTYLSRSELTCLAHGIFIRWSPIAVVKETRSLFWTSDATSITMWVEKHIYAFRNILIVTFAVVQVSSLPFRLQSKRHLDQKPMSKSTLESCIAACRVSNEKTMPLRDGTRSWTCELYPFSKTLTHKTSLAHPWIAHWQLSSHYTTVALGARCYDWWLC